MSTYRTHNLGDLREKDVQSQVIVAGWIQKHRFLGELAFIDLRDTTGICQIVIENPELLEQVKSYRNEYVIIVTGEVRKRKDINQEIATGMIEIIPQKIELVNKAQALPIQIVGQTDAHEDVKLQYRYLELRKESLQNNLKLRHQLKRFVHNFLDTKDFIEVETPYLTKSTPEGARDYLVPSRINHGQFYALPQSPQIYKNLLMLGGVEKYYQIVRAFRDEDLRSDRQPEFTQLDIEMTFMSSEEIMALMQEMFIEMFKEIKAVDVSNKFRVMDYDDAVNNYGLDKPDLRFDLLLHNVTEIFKESEFSVFKSAPAVKTIVVNSGASKYSRKDIDKLTELVKLYEAKGLAWLKYEQEEFKGPIVKFLSEEELANLKNQLQIKSDDLLLFVADKLEIANESLGHLRNQIAIDMDLIDKESYEFAWIINWPLFEYDKEQERYNAMHHPFTMPQDEKFADNPLETRAQAYDLVLNGHEVGGGSIRINKEEIQKQMFEYLKMDEKEVQEKFGFYLEAYRYGAPIHGGIAFGFDRLLMVLSNASSIKDVIAFPKNNAAKDLMMQAPSYVDEQQLDELNISLKE